MTDEAQEKDRKALILLRSTYRRRITNLHKEVIDKAFLPECDLGELSEKIELINQWSGKLEEVDKSLRSFWSDEEREREIDLVVDYQEKVAEAKSRYDRACRNKNLAAVSHNASTTHNNGETSFMSPRSSIKLPTLTLDKYDGNPLKWKQFEDQFQAAVDSNSTLSSAQKLSYLRGCLFGEAAKTIADYSLTDRNYIEAWTALQQQFGKTSVLINAYLQDLRSLPKLKDSDPVSKLRDCYSTCSARLRGLEALNVKVQEMSALLTPMLLASLPESIAISFELEYGFSSIPEVDNLMIFFRKQVEARESVALRRQFDLPASSSLSASYPMEQIRGVRTKTRPATTSALAANIQQVNTQRNKPLPCLFCEKIGHWSTACQTIQTNDARKEILTRKNRCYLCLRPGHVIASCTYYRQACHRCGQKHHPAICSQRSITNQQSIVITDTKTSSQISVQSVHAMSTVVLGTASVWVSGEDGKLLVRCLLDDSSQTSFIQNSVAQRIGAKKINNVVIAVAPFGQDKPIMSKRSIYELHLQSTNGGRTITITALGSDKICQNLPSISDPTILRQLKELKYTLADPPVKSGQEKPIDILLGSDTYWQIVQGQMHPLNNSLGLINTHFGWMINGKIPNSSSAVQNNNTVIVTSVTIEQQLKTFWDLEHAGMISTTPIRDPVMESFSKSAIQIPTGRYAVRLPWNDKASCLNTNYTEALRRLRSLVKKLHERPDLRERYHDAVQAYLTLDQAEEAPETSTGLTYYIPHQAVIKEDRATTKLRVVFDASSHAKNSPSLNDCLHSGPALNPECTSLLIRWRSYIVAFAADIVKAFLQVQIQPEDRDALRFIWLDPEYWSYPYSEESLQKYLREYRMKVVTFGTNCGPFLFCGTVRHHAKKYNTTYPIASEMLDKNIYTDDILGGGYSVSEAYQRYKEIKEILLEACMSVTKWASSSEELHKRWKKEKEETAIDNLLLATESSAKMLGLHWGWKEDCFFFSRNIIPKQPFTKRTVLQIIAQAFDPLGFLGPFTVRAKLIMQQVWLLTTSWDDPLEEPILTLWTTWVNELQEACSIKIPRCLFSNSHKLPVWTLHLFVDASTQAYGAAIYSRVETISSQINTILIVAKNRVAPLKKVTLPRLELLGAVIGARLIQYTLKALDISSPPQKICCWTDSQITLHWIKGDPRQWKTYVGNRVQEIQDLTPPNLWNFCPGTDNPADLLTRGETIKDLKNNNFWWHGPHWLSKASANWPRFKLSEDILTGEEEIKKVVTTICTSTPVIDIHRFSSLSRLLRTTAWVHRICPSYHSTSKDLSIEEIERSNIYWVALTQGEAFQEELDSLQAEQPVSKKSKIAKFAPFLHDGIVRIRGRLQLADLTFNTQHPILLPPGGKFVDLLLLDAHIRLFHAGSQDVLTEIREKYWIIRGRKAAQRVVNKCLICHRLKARPIIAPTAPLPADRILKEPPFSVTGIDFAGPLYVQVAEDQSSKAYAALFTCAVTRAIHVELVTSMNVEAFLLCLRRFFARYGVSRVIYSDNARTFHRTRKELKMILSWIKAQQTKDFLLARSIKWKCIVERAAWWGGFWERMVRSIKERIKRTLGKQVLKFEDLSTFLLEISAAINSRPLCYVSEDVSSFHILTPGHFIHCGRPATLPDSADSSISLTSTKDSILSKWKQRCHLQNQFWKSWQKDYLLQLRNFHQTQDPIGSKIRVGEVVVVQHDHIPRHCWPLARIVKTFPGRDGQTRACEIKLGSQVHLRRAVQHLCPLEL